MRPFETLTEREILALAIALEEEDARIYDDFADGLKENYPEQAEKFKALRREEDGHRHRLLELYKQRFGDHVPLIRRQDVRGFVQRRPVWLVRPLGLKAVQKAAETMEVDTKRFYEAAARRPTDAGVRQLLVDLAASLGAGISMGFAEALSDDGSLTGRGHPWARGFVCGLMTTVGGTGHTLPYLIPDVKTVTG